MEILMNVGIVVCGLVIVGLLVRIWFYFLDENDKINRME